MLLADVWIKPKHVWEISADSFSKSTVYNLGKGKINSNQNKDAGLSLRFPRFIRQRQDKAINIDLLEEKGIDKEYEYGTDVSEII